MRRICFPTRQQWKDELKDLVRGASGGFLFGIPLLYTMEVWWIGSYTSPPLMLTVLAVVFVIVFLLNRTDGFRQGRPDQPIEAVMDSVEAVALSIVCVTLVLVLLREITLDTSLSEALGKIILESVPFAIGIGLARSIMVGGREQSSQEESGEGVEDSPKGNSASQSGALRNGRSSQYNATLADIGATLVGAIFIAFNIAPTDEVPMLSAAASPPSLLAIMAASLAFSYCIVFAAGFTTQEKRLQQQGAFQHPLVETVMAYLLSLMAAAMMLWFFQRLSLSDPWTSWLEQVLILGLPASVGGAAGRLAV
jgi:putative integral membrane protein (TIGR02587 family)